MNTLKPCPMCNNTDNVDMAETSNGEMVYYRCTSCDIDWQPCDTEEEAREAWNTRPREDNDLQKVIEFIKHDLDEGFVEYVDEIIQAAVYRAGLGK